MSNELFAFRLPVELAVKLQALADAAGENRAVVLRELIRFTPLPPTPADPLRPILPLLDASGLAQTHMLEASDGD